VTGWPAGSGPPVHYSWPRHCLCYPGWQQVSMVEWYLHCGISYIKTVKLMRSTAWELSCFIGYWLMTDLTFIPFPVPRLVSRFPGWSGFPLISTPWVETHFLNTSLGT
jgi:hypothetical protein